MTDEQIIQYIKENYPTQSDVYFWSTFILPDGTFVVPENDGYGEDMYEHANIIAGVADNCFDENWLDAEDWLMYNCVKCNADYPYIAYPPKPTKKQYWAAEEYMECITKDTSGFSINVDDYGKDSRTFGGKPVQIIIDNQDEVYSLVVNTPEDITKKVMKASSGGILEEKLNSSVREFTRDSRVRDKDGNLIKCSLLPHESLDNNEYGIYFKRGEDYYLNITNPLFTNETDDIVTYLRKRGYEKELDRFKQMKQVRWDYQLNEVEFVKYLGFDGIITYDKELFIVFDKNQVIDKNLQPKLKKDEFIFESNDNNKNDKEQNIIKIDDTISLSLYEETNDEISYDILVDGKESGILTILPKEQYLKQILVYKTGQGIGTKVLTYLIENDIIDSLDVDRQNEGALHLYEKLGFKPYQLIWGSADGNGNDRYVMIHSNHKLANYYVYYQGDSYSSTYADDKMILLGKTLGSGDNYYVLPTTDEVWEELEDINIYREDVSEMLYHIKHGRVY